jgi:hypothetical protein
MAATAYPAVSPPGKRTFDPADSIDERASGE